MSNKNEIDKRFHELVEFIIKRTKEEIEKECYIIPKNDRPEKHVDIFGLRDNNTTLRWLNNKD